MAVRQKSASRAPEHLRLEGQVVGLWFQMQARLDAHFTELAAQHSLSAVQAKVLLTLPADGAATMRALAGELQYDASNLTGVVDRLEAMGARPRGRGGRSAPSLIRRTGVSSGSSSPRRGGASGRHSGRG